MKKFNVKNVFILVENPDNYKILKKSLLTAVPSMLRLEEPSWTHIDSYVFEKLHARPAFWNNDEKERNLILISSKHGKAGEALEIMQDSRLALVSYAIVNPFGQTPATWDNSIIHLEGFRIDCMQNEKKLESHVNTSNWCAEGHHQLTEIIT